ncbi:MAG: DUF4149 domain-containing protein [Halobacteriovoraceae bacterium]|nr:DUF4149 domain-containing protein [Halobacteriovoraceae bacterium]
MPIVIMMFVLSMWLGTTLLVDFVAVPTVFRTLNELYSAGEVGISIFSKYVYAEIILCAFAIFTAFFLKKKWKYILPLLVLGTGLGGYFYIIIPKITAFTGELKKLEEMKLVGELIKTYEISSQSLDYFHSLYIKMDSGKIVFLVILILFLFFDARKLRETT